MASTKPKDTHEWITLRGAARAARCAPRLIREARDKGELEVIQLGDRWQRVHVAELARWMRMHRVPPATTTDKRTQAWLKGALRQEARRGSD